VEKLDAEFAEFEAARMAAKARSCSDLERARAECSRCRRDLRRDRAALPRIRVCPAKQAVDDGAGKSGEFQELRKRKRAAFDGEKILEALFFSGRGFRGFGSLGSLSRR
jgi:hypothetical protein